MQPSGSVEQVRIAFPDAQQESDERLEYLLRRAAGIVVAGVRSIPARLDAGELGLLDLVDGVLTDMVIRALRNPDGARSRSSTVGPFTESVTFSDGSSDLALLESERLQLAPASTGSSRRIGSIRVRPC